MLNAKQQLQVKRIDLTAQRANIRAMRSCAKRIGGHGAAEAGGTEYQEALEDIAKALVEVTLLISAFSPNYGVDG